MEKNFYRELISVSNNPLVSHLYLILENDEKGYRASLVDFRAGEVVWEEKYSDCLVDLLN